ncbi:MAG: DUF1015 domain-containing protein [Candidatus Omnitrophica bacterium]|nr:DUF1015 domain-containing protein [Candidatus Omnitrophota bacterium]
MVEIKPFRAVIYNQEKIKDLSRVVCPPYDIISPAQQEYLRKKDQHNFIHILLGRDIPGEDKYIRAAGYLKDWMDENIFIQDIEPAIYFYSHSYQIKGEKKMRLGFVSLLKLPDKPNSVFAHEHTRLAPKEDRLRLLRRTKANLSPIFVIFQDKKRIIQYIWDKGIGEAPPFIEVRDDEKNLHRLWRITSSDLLRRIEDGMCNENIFIADGHHRYEVACAYKEEMKKKLGEAFTGKEDFNYLMAYFTNTDQRGLSILPIHRLIKTEKVINEEELKLKLREYFNIIEVKDKTRFFFLMQKGGRTENLLGVYLQKRFYLLRLKNVKIPDKLMKDKPKAYRTLDVSILNELVLKTIFGIESNDKENIVYTVDNEEAIASVDSGSFALAFFLNPVDMSKIIAVALAEERMPSKSTYFYPKVMSGLLINKFNLR